VLFRSYMQNLQILTGQGGWPLNDFLAPDDLVPFYGGTYFPLEPKYGRPGFLQILQALRNFFDTEDTKVASIREEILGRLHQVTASQPTGEFTTNLLQLGLEYSAGVISTKNMGPSFPMMPYAEAALRGVRFNFAEARYDARQSCHQRGLDLALGGIFDHVAGGFHRYTVDSSWTVPHFEKMLYDNGQIMEFLANLWSLGVQEPAFERAIALTVGWLKREMTAPQGYFYAAQDADSFFAPEDTEPEEGAFYVWPYDDLCQSLAPAALEELMRLFTVTEAGNFEGKNVLQRRTSEDLKDLGIEATLNQLFAIRYGQVNLDRFPPARTNQEAKTTAWPGRIPPVTDTKMIVAWNSLMISGLARAAMVLQNQDYLTLAATATQFILDHQWVNGQFHRLNYDGLPAVLAQAEDFAFFIKALLDLEQATQVLDTQAEGAPSWLDRALQVQGEFDECLWSIEGGGYYNTHASQDLVIRERSVDDHATPSANGVAIANLVRLSLLTEDLDYLHRAEQALLAFSSTMNEAPQRCPSLFVALDWYRNATLIRAEAGAIAPIALQYLPTAVLKSSSELPEGIVGMVCQGLSCKEPARTLAQFQAQIQQSLSRTN